MKRTLLFALALIAVGCGPDRPEGQDMAELARATVRRQDLSTNVH
jgi:hypothetical protein